MDQSGYAAQPEPGNNEPASSYQATAPAYEQLAESNDPPPPLPEYDQPPCPGENYIWTPGYWEYSDAGFYWVPGAWVLAPWVGALWTPPWWGFDNGVYLLHAGYWGPHIGFYGGIDYGFGYPGRGYYGAYWNRGTVAYNINVTNVDRTRVHEVYNFAVPNYRRGRVSYNAGRGGINAAPTAQESAVARDPRTPALQAQTQQAREALSNRGQSAAAGRPAALVIARPLATNYRAPAERPPAEAMRAIARPGEARPAMPANERVGATPETRPVPEQPRQAAPVEPRPFEPRPNVAAGRPAPNAPQYEQRRTEPIPIRNPAIPPSPQAAPPPVIQRPVNGQRARNFPAQSAVHANPEARPPQIERAVERPAMPEPRAQAGPPHSQSPHQVMQQARPPAQPQAAPAHPAPQVHAAPQQRDHAAPAQQDDKKKKTQ